MSSEILPMYSTRVAIGHPATREVRILTVESAPAINKWRGLLGGDFREGILQHVAGLKEYGEQQNVPASRSVVCAVALDQEFLMSWINLAQDAIGKGNIPFFRFYFDFLWGASHVWRGIQEAWDEAERTPEESDQYAMERAKADIKDLGELADGLTTEEGWQTAKSKKLEASQLIQDDPTGFSLTDLYVDRFKNDPEQVIDPNQVQQYALLGAETARDMYKSLYEMAEPVYNRRNE